jgi:hypothetical protein
MADGRDVNHARCTSSVGRVKPARLWCEAKTAGFTPYALTKLVFISKPRKSITTTLFASGLKIPLKHAGARNKRGGVSAKEGGSSQSRLPPTRLSAAQGLSWFAVVAWLRFLAKQERKAPRWLTALKSTCRRH